MSRYTTAASGAAATLPVRPSESHLAARALQALELLTAQPLTAPQLAAALQVDPRTARRLLSRLSEDGWLTHSDGRARVYAPSLRIAALAAHVVRRDAVAELAMVHVRAVSAELGGPAHFMVPSYRWMLCLVHGDGKAPRAGLHELVPCHTTASGKALLGWWAGWRASVLSTPLSPSTAATIVDPRALLAEVAAAVVQGYATENGEWREGERAVAAPVFDGAGDARWALSGSVPGARDIDLAGRFVAEHAKELSARLAARFASC
jgi:IclR family acetate operon transcriptional repressor